jgi:hypothetical protein
VLYVALMTDRRPPFRLERGRVDPEGAAESGEAPYVRASAVAPTCKTPSRRWRVSRISAASADFTG